MKTILAALVVQMTVVAAGAEAALESSVNIAAAPALSSDVFEAARFAARDRSVRLLQIRSAQTPDAEELSYRLCLLVRGDSGRFRAAAVIGRSGPHRLALTKWHPGGC